jgi:hypothetical protein
MAKEVGLIVELTRDSAVDRNVRADLPPSITGGRVVLDHIEADDLGRLDPPPVGEVVLTVLSPEALRRDPEVVADAVAQAADSDQPPVIVVEAAEYLREDEIAAVLDAADRADRVVILRVMADA